MTRIPVFTSSLILIAVLASGLFAQRTSAQGICTLSALGEVPVYSDPGKTQVAAMMQPGDGGQVMGQLKDGTYGIALGLYYVETTPLEAMRWVDASANIALNGPCDDLPLIPLTCVLDFEAPTNAYTQPDTSAPVGETYDNNDTYSLIEVVGWQADGWYAIPNPRLPASTVGTRRLLWVQAGPNVYVGGNCPHLPALYPTPKLPGEMCTVRTPPNGESHLKPDTSNTSVTPLPNTTVQILAVASPVWYGYDPATWQDGAVGESRLRWINVSDAQISGDCEHVPLISVGVKRLEAADSGSTIETAVGNTFLISLPSEFRPGVSWAQTATSPAHASGVLIQQGKPISVGTSDGLGIDTFAFQAVSAGKTTIELDYTSLYGAPSDAFAHTFTVTVNVLPAKTLGR